MIVNTPFIYDRNCIRIYEEITNNAITIDGIDYFVDSISPGCIIRSIPTQYFLLN